MKRIISFVLVIALLALPMAGAEESIETSASVPGVSAGAWAVYDATAGRFLASGAGDEGRRMASTTKIMTALVAIENFSLETEVEFTRDMIAEGSSMYLKIGEKAALRDLLYGLMLMSGNDAAKAIASLGEGGEPGFVRLMNEKAEELGLKNTSFANPNGLDADGHHTTAKELALIAAAAMENETFREIVSTYSGIFAGRAMTNHNKLLRRIDGCIGVKTGYTIASGRCLVSAVERDGRMVIVVTLNAPSDWSDHERLHEWAFERYSSREIVCSEQVYGYIPVEGGLSAKVAVRAEETLTLSLTDEEYSHLETAVYLPRFVYAPIQAGASAGEIVVTLDGSELARAELVYDGDAERAAPRELNFGEKVKDWFETLAWKLGLC